MTEDTAPGYPEQHGILLRLFGLPNLKIRTKAYLAAGGATGALFVLALIFMSVLHEQKATLNDIDRVYFPRATTFSNYFSQLSQIHSGLFDLLVTAEDTLDEETVYLTAKPKLLKIRQVMQDIAASSETFQLEGRDRAVVDNLNTIMQTYFRSAAQAIEMATVDTRLARKYMVSANRSYQRVNEVLGELVGSSRSDTGNAISLARDGIGYHSLQVGIILVGAVSLIALLGWATSRTLVLDLNGIKQKLTSLAAGDTRGDLMPAKRSGEIGEMIEALEVFRQNVIEVARVNKALQDRERDMRLAKEQAELDKKNALDELRTVVEEKAQREIDMVHSQKLESLGTLAGGVAHEINTPIQYIGNNLEFLQEASDEVLLILKKCDQLSGSLASLPPEFAELGEIIADVDPEYLAEEIPASLMQSLKGANHIRDIVMAIKEYSHPGSKTKTPVDLNNALRNVITVARIQWKDCAEVSTDLDPDLPLVNCLPGELNQVVLNLIVNAAQAIEDVAGEEKGSIIVSTWRDDQWAEIAIRDSGPGISEEHLAKIFEPFFTTKEPGKGTGQGLAIAHAIVTSKHGGELSVRSTVGEGTEFNIRLPLGNDEEVVAAA